MLRPKGLYALGFMLLAGCDAGLPGDAQSNDAALQAPGLNASYFPSQDFTGTPVKRVDATLNKDWSTGSPVAGIGVDHFSVRWTGFVVPRFTERYRFTTTSDDGVRVSVDGKQIINAWNDHAARADSGDVALTAGKAVPLTVEYYENGGSAVLKLAWSSVHQAAQIIPSSQLQTGSSEGNLLANPSFELGTQGWTGWQAVLTQVALVGAPDGKFVARVVPAAGATAYSLDDSPDNVKSAGAGTSYSASAYVAAASPSSVGKLVTLNLREKNSTGTVNLWQASVALTTSMQRLITSSTAVTAGNSVDVYVWQEGAASTDAFYADALTLSVSGVPPNPTPSGEAMPTGSITSNGISWKPVFSDDFSIPAPLGTFETKYATQWGAYGPGWTDTSKNGTYDASKTTSVSGGMLDLWLHTESGTHYVSAPTPKIPYGMTYGRYAVRFKSDAVAGYKTAWLLWPDSGKWPDDGEIDFPEGGLNDRISGYMHYASAGGGQDAFENLSSYGGSGWHTAVTEWSAGRVTFMLDGKVVGTSTRSVPHNPMHYVLQTETSLGGAAPSASAQGHVNLDWIVVYQPT